MNPLWSSFPESSYLDSVNFLSDLVLSFWLSSLNLLRICYPDVSVIFVGTHSLSEPLVLKYGILSGGASFWDSSQFYGKKNLCSFLMCILTKWIKLTKYNLEFQWPLWETFRLLKFVFLGTKLEDWL